MKQKEKVNMDIMIDLETLGTYVDAPIISIGAQAFDLEKGILTDTFYMALDVKDQLDTKKRFMSSDTFKWWLSQSAGAKGVFRENATPTEVALQTLAGWILGLAGSKAQSTRKICVWGNGSSFDITLMETLFVDYGVKCPWMYYKVMDLRTFKRLIAGGASIEVEGTAHNALDDARAQAQYVLHHWGIKLNEKAELQRLREMEKELEKLEASEKE